MKTSFEPTNSNLFDNASGPIIDWRGVRLDRTTFSYFDRSQTGMLQSTDLAGNQTGYVAPSGGGIGGVNVGTQTGNLGGGSTSTGGSTGGAVGGVNVGTQLGGGGSSGSTSTGSSVGTGSGGSTTSGGGIFGGGGGGGGFLPDSSPQDPSKQDIKPTGVNQSDMLFGFPKKYVIGAGFVAAAGIIFFAYKKIKK